MHQLRRGKRSNTVPGVHGSTKGKLMQHTCGARTPCIVCGKWKIVKSEQSHLRLMINPCLAAFPWEGHGGGWVVLVHFPLWRRLKEKNKSSIPRREYCSLIDYAEIFHSGNAIHRFWHGAVTAKIAPKPRLRVFTINKTSWRISKSSPTCI